MNRQQYLSKSLALLRHHRHSSAPRSSALSTTTTTSRPSRKKINLEESLSSSDSNKPPNSQPFVTHRLRPGQPNPLSQIYKRRNIKSDPIFRPPWRHNKANIISAEDFANRPRVTFEEQFDSLHDGMIILSWLNDKQRQDIYNAYTQMMIDQDAKFQTSSHEYVMRVIGEKFNISSRRVGAIVQHCHDEEQVAKTNPELVHDKVAEYVDAKIQEHINNCYSAYGEVNPNEFIETPVEAGDNNLQNLTGEFVAVEDLYDVDELMKEAILREKDEAQLEIDGHVYKEDVFDNDIESKVNKECLDLLEANNNVFKSLPKSYARNDDTTENPMPQGGKIEIEDEEGNTIVKEVTRRPRWKFVAQTINTMDEKKKREKTGRRKKASKEKKTNTLVEEDGLLRVATVKEVNDVAWKEVRDEVEFGFQGVKSAWIRRKNGEKGGWGRVPEDIKAAARAKLEEKEKEALKDEEGEDGESSDTTSEEGTDETK